jgi:hypothetical protein
MSTEAWCWEWRREDGTVLAQAMSTGSMPVSILLEDVVGPYDVHLKRGDGEWVKIAYIDPQTVKMLATVDGRAVSVLTDWWI